MTILHIYDENDAMAGRYVEMLMQATQVLSGENSLFDEPCVMYACTNAKDCRQFLAGCLADSSSGHLSPNDQTTNSPNDQIILHLHGATAPFTLPAGMRLVVTPHGEVLGPLHAYVVLARSPHEAEVLRQKFPHVETVRNPLITRAISPGQCAKQMADVYRRVMDSNVLQLMDTDTRRLLTAALAVATYGDVAWLPSTFHYAAEKANYRQLFLYADNEGVLPLVQQGLEMLGYAEDTEQVNDSYLPPDYQRPQPMPAASISELLADISAHGPSLLRLCEVARALHDERLDEDVLVGQLEADGQLALLAALLPLLADCVLLTEGFMPCQPQEGATTQKLRTMLAQRQEI